MKSSLELISRVLEHSGVIMMDYIRPEQGGFGSVEDRGGDNGSLIRNYSHKSHGRFRRDRLARPASNQSKDDVSIPTLALVNLVLSAHPKPAPLELSLIPSRPTPQGRRKLLDVLSESS
jgi:hypothetical protein